jgi:hypothetical protein
VVGQQANIRRYRLYLGLRRDSFGLLNYILLQESVTGKSLGNLFISSYCYTVYRSPDQLMRVSVEAECGKMISDSQVRSSLQTSVNMAKNGAIQN